MSKELEALRKVRNTLLTECDWTILPSSPLSAEKQDEWKVYRQALRDITKTASPKVSADLTEHKSDNAVAALIDSSVTWPTKPS